MNDDWRKRLREAIDRSDRSMREVSLAAGRAHGYVNSILFHALPIVSFFADTTLDMSSKADRVAITPKRSASNMGNEDGEGKSQDDRD